MQELLLFGQVRSDEALVSVLTGLTGMPPQRQIQRHAIYKPNVAASALSNAPVHIGGTQSINLDKRKPKTQTTQNQEVLFLKLVENLKGSRFGDETQPGTLEDKQWTIVTNDVPLPGQRPVIQRTIQSVKPTTDDPHEKMISENNSFVSEYITDGVRFTHNAIDVHISQIRTFPQTEHLVNAPRSPLPALDSLDLLDSSGAYLVEASVKLEHEPTPNLIRIGTEQLLRFQRDMQGVVKLVTPDRLSLDTRLKAGR